ncbi:MKI67 FHA domain-interacting nucleolar phosphoprotein [Trichoplusia ni]|uniref:MKI67 FHA domain-interacting nucleolar phosphoprotein n=1 Tax=Trichoplusia ni TaxID=7111 RepID=A0A7E5WAD3_TRINI|nr:MKI67 FHA domain-interacting nucleolar phosphoprotein [Trichoplusia ni]
MEEIVALDSKKQKKFVKSIKGIKKLIKKNEGKPEVPKKEEKVELPQKTFSMKLNGSPVQHKKRKERGLVYLSHIPHGFYEHQMTQYFKQFGVVTNARVIKSKRTGNSKGCAFVEFKEPAVGQIVAETMNNYLMGKRLIKAEYIPPEKQKLKAFRKHWNAVNNPSSQARLKMKKIINTDKDEKGDLQKARQLLSNLTKTKKRLSKLGINYDFFTPVDVPEGLVNKTVKEEKEVSEEKPSKTKGKKGKVQEFEVENVKPKDEPTTLGPKKGKAETKRPEPAPAKAKAEIKKPEPAREKAKAETKKPGPAPEKAKAETIKPQGKKARRGSVFTEEFIEIAESVSGSDDGFDSDAFEKELNDESDDDATDDSSEGEEEQAPERQIILPKMQKKVMLAPVKPNKKPQNVQVQKPQKKVQIQNQLQGIELKRKATPKPAPPTKKPKFEKQHQKQTKKSFKKK